MQVGRLRRAVAVAATLLCTVGCDASAPSDDYSDAVPLKGTDGIRPEIQAELLAKAEKGDWKAARELANYRWFVARAYDATTLKLVRLWAEHEPEGGPYMLALVLSRSCDLAQRREGIEVYEAFVVAPLFLLRPAGEREALLKDLAAMKSRVEQTPSPCATY